MIPFVGLKLPKINGTVAGNDLFLIKLELTDRASDIVLAVEGDVGAVAVESGVKVASAVAVGRLAGIDICYLAADLLFKIVENDAAIGLIALRIDVTDKACLIGVIQAVNVIIVQLEVIGYCIFAALIGMEDHGTDEFVVSSAEYHKFLVVFPMIMRIALVVGEVVQILSVSVGSEQNSCPLSVGLTLKIAQQNKESVCRGVEGDVVNHQLFVAIGFFGERFAHLLIAEDQLGGVIFNVTDNAAAVFACRS
jgi:hypothetical protein